MISVEDEIARTLGVGLGDTLTFDVQGVPIERPRSPASARWTGGASAPTSS